MSDQNKKDDLVDPSEIAVKEPGRWGVVLHNDDFTTMEFVVEVLRKYFGKEHEQAMALMLKIHESGSAVCGTFTFEIAETKVYQVTEDARANGYPLKCTMEEV